MSETVTIADFSTAIMKIMDEYGDEAQHIIDEEVEAYAKKAQRMLRARSPERTGSYKKGWRLKVYRTRLSAKAVTYNATDYQLTHLLEKGHASRNGGRVPPVEHIAPVNDEIQEDFYKTVKERLS